MYKYLIGVCVMCIGLGVADGAGRWSRTGNVNTDRQGYAGALLTDGRVMVVGGLTEPECGTYELFDPATGTWKLGNLPSDTSGWNHPNLILLPNGTAFYISTNEWYTGQFNPVTETWSPTALFDAWSSRTCITLLNNGKVLAIDYDYFNKCAVYDWTSGGIQIVGSTQYRHTNGGVEVILPSGEVLAIGGSQNQYSTELYNPTTQLWYPRSNMQIDRQQFVGVLLPPPWSEVLAAGSWSDVPQTELFNPTANTWTFTNGGLNEPKRGVCAMALLPNGKPLIMGGYMWLETCELYDPVSKTWSYTDTMDTARSHFGTVILQTGKVMAISGSLDGGVQYETPTCEIYDPSTGYFEAKGNLITARSAHTTTPLPIIHTVNCSTTVLIVGGENSTGALRTCELYNYSTAQTAATGNLNTARSHHIAQLLATGKVFVAGGKNVGAAINSCELFDIPTENWASIAPMAQARFDHTATLLKDGRVLITGGEASSNSLNTCEVYNPASGWTTTNPMSQARARQVATLLLDGRILVTGGQSGSVTNTCELWNPTGGNWTPANPLTTGRYHHTAVLLQSGKVLVIGGRDGSGNAISSCEIYDPATGLWSNGPSLNYARYCHNAVLLYSGMILVTGGRTGSADLSMWEVYDPATNKWKDEGSPTVSRHYYTLTMVPGLHPYVLIIGGKNVASTYFASIERYDVGLGYQRDWQSRISNYPSVTPISPSMNIQGQLFRGVSEADGGNQCHMASNDHPIISVVRIGGGNWQGNGGGEIMYTPSSTNWDASHTIVTNPETPQGYFRLWAIVNGIPTKWYEVCVDVEENTNDVRQTIMFAVIPNPAIGGKIMFKSIGKDANFAKTKIEIYDCTGRVVRTINNNTNKEIEVKNLKSGIYFYRIESNTFTHKGKFIVID
ncbi:MAG: T9SS type A sorting domain-containing protein [Candidatus Stahlbacteria bacterium]|nr:T9SS type A sorting domain-containing protein [Candidatus Stahlbacteria bacterium]